MPLAGAMAPGNRLCMFGPRLVGTAAFGLARRGRGQGGGGALAATCFGAGQGIALVVETLRGNTQ